MPGHSFLQVRVESCFLLYRNLASPHVYGPGSSLPSESVTFDLQWPDERRPDSGTLALLRQQGSGCPRPSGKSPAESGPTRPQRFSSRKKSSKSGWKCSNNGQTPVVPTRAAPRQRCALVRTRHTAAAAAEVVVAVEPAAGVGRTCSAGSQ